MTKTQLHALCDGAYQLLGAAEAAERDPEKYDEAALRELFEPLLRAVLPLYTREQVDELQLEEALRAHGGDTAAAARALGVSRRTMYNRAPSKRSAA